MRTQIVELILASLEDLRDALESPVAEFSEQTVLFGPVSSALDSMGLVTLIVELEQKLEQEYGLSLTLADDRAMSQRHSPFRTVQSLAEYICLLLEESTHE